MHQIETGTRSPDELHDCSFLWLFCRDGQPYPKYLPAGAPETMPMVFALLRWDGTFGTMGGKVDAEESLLQGLSREAFEEVGFEVPACAKLEPLATIKDGAWHIHSFCWELPYKVLQALRASASARVGAAEVAGCVLAPAGAYLSAGGNIPRGIGAFLNNQFCSTAKMELELLLAKLRSES